MKKINIGHINFLNVLPLNYYYSIKGEKNFKITNGVPAIINEKMKNGFLDVSLMSSIEYARQNKNLLLIPKICVRADSEVTSIILVTKKPIEELDGEKLSITAKSATANCLLKIIFAESYKIKPNYFVENLRVESPIPENSVAALFIGDEALYLHLNREKKYFYYDLGFEWKKLTGQQMVYAVWAARKNFAKNNPEGLKDSCQKIYEGLEYGLKNKNLAINSVLGKVPFNFKNLDEYLGGAIKWDLTSEGIDALKKFYELANKNKLLEEIPQIEMAGV